MQAVMLPSNHLTRTEKEILDRVMKGKQIISVYQPIISLEDGQIYGYEALSRITNEQYSMEIEHLFRVADQWNRIWQLEQLCRKKALEHTTHMHINRKLFIQINPNLLYDEDFQKEFTKQYLFQYGLYCQNIVLETSERTPVLNKNAYFKAVRHYQEQGFGIAVDNVGIGYEGFNLLSDMMPNLIKLDKQLVKDVDKDRTKFLLCRAIVDFCKNKGIKLIAAGIETERELAAFIDLDVDFGQGLYLCEPKEEPRDIVVNKTDSILLCQKQKFLKASEHFRYPNVGYLAKPGYCFSPEDKTESIYEKMKEDPGITGFSIVENGTVLGYMSKTDLNTALGGRFGFNLNARKAIRILAKSDFLKVKDTMHINQVSKMAMQRPFEQLYNPIVVEQDGRYYGIVTIKDLLDACMKVDMDIAVHANPLTGLPGNILIDQEIHSHISGNKPYCIIYFDIDNFKAYNDVYGFQYGDKMIKLVAEILKEYAVNNEFVGHIGGDDFIVVCNYQDGGSYCRLIIRAFEVQVLALYKADDLKRGYIESKNRNGAMEQFPAASLSIAGISNREHTYQNVEDFSKDIAGLKKKCKQHPGNYYEIL